LFVIFLYAYPLRRDKPIYVIGSGKTAMDVIYHLCKTGDPHMRNRLHCIAGYPHKPSNPIYLIILRDLFNPENPDNLNSI
jgi:lysine/ornithine N-monooxygenase